MAADDLIDLPEMQDVSSSNVSQVGHDPNVNALYVRFSNGGLYRFHEVGADAFSDLTGADSPGRHFAQNIRGKFSHEKIG